MEGIRHSLRSPRRYGEAHHPPGGACSVRCDESTGCGDSAAGAGPSYPTAVQVAVIRLSSVERWSRVIVPAVQPVINRPAGAMSATVRWSDPLLNPRLGAAIHRVKTDTQAPAGRSGADGVGSPHAHVRAGRGEPAVGLARMTVQSCPTTLRDRSSAGAAVAGAVSAWAGLDSPRSALAGLDQLSRGPGRPVFGCGPGLGAVSEVVAVEPV